MFSRPLQFFWVVLLLTSAAEGNFGGSSWADESSQSNHFPQVVALDKATKTAELLPARIEPIGDGLARIPSGEALTVNGMLEFQISEEEMSAAAAQVGGFKIRKAEIDQFSCELRHKDRVLWTNPRSSGPVQPMLFQADLTGVSSYKEIVFIAHFTRVMKVKLRGVSIHFDWNGIFEILAKKVSKEMEIDEASIDDCLHLAMKSGAIKVQIESTEMPPSESKLFELIRAHCRKRLQEGPGNSQEASKSSTASTVVRRTKSGLHVAFRLGLQADSKTKRAIETLNLNESRIFEVTDSVPCDCPALNQLLEIKR